MVISNIGGQDWHMDPAGKIRVGPADPSVPARARGWIDPKGSIGGVETVDGEPASVDLLPAEILDLLEQRFPGTRWFVGQGRSSAA